MMQTTIINKEYENENIRFIDILTCMFCAYRISGSRNDMFLYISLGLFFIWFFVAFLTKPSFINTCLNDKKIICLFIYLLYAFISGLISGSILHLIKQLGAGPLMFSPIFIFNYYRSCGKKNIKFVLGVILVSWLFFTIKAIHFFTVNIDSAKVLTANSNAYGDIAIGGGILLAYATALISTILVDFIIQKRKRAVCIVFLILALYLLVKTESTVTLVCAICGMAFSYISAPGRNHQRYIRLILSTIIIVAFVMNIENIGKMVVGLGEGLDSTFGNRIKSLGFALMGDANGGEYATNRASVLFRSLKTFLKYPLTGVCYQHGNAYYYVEDFGVGNHCAWFDVLANYGIIFGFVFYFIYIFQAKEILKSKNKLFSKGWLFCLIMMGCFNPIISYQINLVLCFVMPAMCLIIDEKPIKGERTQ